MTTETFMITRTFAAPRSLVWKAWTKPEMLAQWFGPKDTGCKILKHDLRVGGMVHSRIDIPGGTIMWGKFTYQEIVPETKLSWLHSFSDETGTGLTRHPFNPLWPLVLLTTVQFEEDGNKTKLVLTWTPHEAEAAERKAFVDGMAGATQGWGGCFDQLDAFLANKEAA